MQDLCDVFRQELKVDLPLALPPDCVPVTPDGLLVGSTDAAQRPLLAQGDISRFLSVADGYFLAGFWGHGINSYAFYWCVADTRQRVFLRLPYGGVYMDAETTGAEVLSALRGYAAFWTHPAAAEVTRLVVVSAMGEGEALAQFADGTYACTDEPGQGVDPFKELNLARRCKTVPSSRLVRGLGAQIPKR
jgi:hypothetical protein